jgi:hypothetical protein
VKGKLWTVEEEKLLRSLIAEGSSVEEAAEMLRKSYASVAAKMKRLSIGVKQDDNNRDSAQSQLLSSKLEPPLDLPSVEDQLRVLAAAVDALKVPGLCKDEVLRLRSIIGGVRVYKELFVDYVNYRGIEEKVDNVIKELQRLEKGPSNMERKKQ